MADAVSALLDRECQTVRASARARAEHFPWRRTAASVLAVHLGLVEQEGCA